MNFFLKKSLDGAVYLWGSMQFLNDSENPTNASSQIKSISEGGLCITAVLCKPNKDGMFRMFTDATFHYFLAQKIQWVNKAIVNARSTIQQAKCMQDYFKVK